MSETKTKFEQKNDAHWMQYFRITFVCIHEMDIRKLV